MWWARRVSLREHWAHFWTGIPIALTGIGGTVSVMAANSWMNRPGGLTLNGHVYFGLPIPDADSLLVGFSPRVFREAVRVAARRSPNGRCDAGVRDSHLCAASSPASGCSLRHR
jgi:cytochrome bd-type quinol oxidase subunit 1